ncbi:hypothetical protein GGR57DRAFT_452799 [Xylariaceae sp. FL1272]|nr:hypothetical protein GGR57DRAFT_452799 [Xylariaceae sp. FL1272]
MNRQGISCCFFGDESPSPRSSSEGHSESPISMISVDANVSKDQDFEPISRTLEEVRNKISVTRKSLLQCHMEQQMEEQRARRRRLRETAESVLPSMSEWPAARPLSALGSIMEVITPPTAPPPGVYGPAFGRFPPPFPPPFPVPPAHTDDQPDRPYGHPPPSRPPYLQSSLLTGLSHMYPPGVPSLLPPHMGHALAPPYVREGSPPVIQRPTPLPTQRSETKIVPPEVASLQPILRPGLNLNAESSPASKDHSETVPSSAANHMGDNDALNKFLTIQRADFSTGKEFLRECQRLREQCAEHWKLRFTKSLLTCHLIRALETHKPIEAKLLRWRYLSGDIEFQDLKQYIAAPDLVWDKIPKKSRATESVPDRDESDEKLDKDLDELYDKL